MGQKGLIAFLATHERNLCWSEWIEMVRDWFAGPARSANRNANARAPERLVVPAATLSQGRG